MPSAVGAWVAVSLGALGGCATTTRVPEVDAGPAAGRVFDGRTGAVLSPDEVLARLTAARVVLVAEEHANPAFHAVQAEVVEVLERLAVASGDASGVALAIEWLPASSRATLEGWSAGDAAVEALRVATRWDEVWGHAFEAYEPLLLRVRAARVPILPINAEPGLARLVARGGVEGVPPERRAELPPLDSGNDAHRAWFAERMRDAGHGHAVEGAALERFYLAQLVWDETMAANVRAAAASYEHVVVAAGAGHVERGLGIAARLGPLRSLIVMPVADRADLAAHVSDAPFPDREADLLWLAP